MFPDVAPEMPAQTVYVYATTTLNDLVAILAPSFPSGKTISQFNVVFANGASYAMGLDPSGQTGARTIAATLAYDQALFGKVASPSKLTKFEVLLR